MPRRLSLSLIMVFGVMIGVLSALPSQSDVHVESDAGPSLSNDEVLRFLVENREQILNMLDHEDVTSGF